MQKAKQAAASFLHKDGKHNTIVDQEIRGAVTDEHVRPHEHEVVSTAVDREVHQDHHQTRIQPVTATETRPETSSHVVAPIQHTTHEHGNDAELRSKLESEAAAYKNTSVTHDATHSTETAPVKTGEHVHHHVHETIQPIIEKQTIKPHVVHKTVPVHETHHAAPIHHEATTLPTKTLEEFTSGHGISATEGKATATLREFNGCPGPYNKERELPQTALHGGSNEAQQRLSNASSERDYTTTEHHAGVNGTGNVPRSSNKVGHNLENSYNESTQNTTYKPSLMDKLNPAKDANGDGKKGIMS